ncbi:MAG: hypothetical protein WBL80_03650 [Erysipelotrichaceae bacterium]
MKYFDALCCSVLIGYEYKWLSKIQFNIYSPKGSIHLEYKDRTVSIYDRGLFDEHSTLTMSVAIIPSFGIGHISTVSGLSLLGCFNEYLRISDQRSATIEKKSLQLVRKEILPYSSFSSASEFDETVFISVDSANDPNSK